jgi:hypothetical protein
MYLLINLMNFKQQLTIHIQGLPFNTYDYFQEIDNTNNIGPCSIQKIGGYMPQKLEIIFINSDYQLEGQAYMVKYTKGNLEATMVNDGVILPNVVPPRLSDSIYSLRLCIPTLEISPKGWFGIYGEDGLDVCSTYSTIKVNNEYIELPSPSSC